MNHYSLRAVLIFLGFLVFAPAPMAQVQFVPLPIEFRGIDINHDGTVVVGYPSSSLNHQYGISLWSLGQPLLPIATRSAQSQVSFQIIEMSDDGSDVLFWAAGPTGDTWLDASGNPHGHGSFLWQQGIGMTPLQEYLDPNTGSLRPVRAYTLSGDGRVIFGRTDDGGANPSELEWMDLGAPSLTCWQSPHTLVSIRSNYDGTVVAIRNVPANGIAELWYVNNCVVSVLTAVDLGIPHRTPLNSYPALNSSGTLLAINERIFPGNNRQIVFSPASGVLFNGVSGSVHTLYFSGDSVLYSPRGVWELGIGFQSQRDYYRQLGSNICGEFFPNRPSSTGNAVLGAVSSRFCGTFPNYQWYPCVAYIHQPVPGTIGSNYCGQAPKNSTGFPSLLNAKGSATISNNNLILEATFLPEGQF